MQTDRIVTLLRNAIARFEAQPFDWFACLREEHFFEELGKPGSDGDYCQIELEVLDRFMDKDVEVLHLLGIARDEKREFGADLFVC